MDGTKKRKTLLIVAGSVLALIVAVVLFLVIVNVFYPLEAAKEAETVYITRGQAAITSIEFKNKSGSPRDLKLKYGEGQTLEKTIPAKSREAVALDFGAASQDTDAVVKYGFMDTKKVNVRIVAVESHQIGFTAANIKIKDENGTDLTHKKYCDPNKKVLFEVTASNRSGKDFKKEYEMKIGDQVVQTRTADWKAPNNNSAVMTFEHVFDKQGFYKIVIGTVSINFICSTNDKPPANNKMLLHKLSGGRGVLKIENKYNHPVIVTLCREDSPDKALNKVYIRAKSSASIRGIKDGAYIIYMKGGIGYSKMARDILEPTVAYKSVKAMKFTTTSTTYSIWTVKIGVKGGNMGIVPIDDNNIPN